METAPGGPTLTTAQIETRILDALRDIRTHWAALLELVERGNASAGASSTDDVTALDRLISLRHEVHMCLNSWARVIMEDRPVTKALPDGRDTLGLVEFLERHAEWFSGHEAARDAGDEFAEWASEVKATAEPNVREWLYLGDCPFVLDFGGDLDLRIESDEPPFACTGRVRAPIGGDEETAACTDCGQYGPIGWWEDVLGLGSPPVSAERMAEILHRRLGKRVTGRTLRNWARHGAIHSHVEPFGPAPRHPRFDPRTVMDEVSRMNRACVLCGMPWAGTGDLCRPCHVVARDAKPGRAELKSDFTVVSIPRRPVEVVVVDDPDDDERPDRCHCCDLDTRWCFRVANGGQPASA